MIHNLYVKNVSSSKISFHFPSIQASSQCNTIQIVEVPFLQSSGNYSVVENFNLLYIYKFVCTTKEIFLQDFLQENVSLLQLEEGRSGTCDWMDVVRAITGHQKVSKWFTKIHDGTFFWCEIYTLEPNPVIATIAP